MSNQLRSFKRNAHGNHTAHGLRNECGRLIDLKHDFGNKIVDATNR